MKDYDEDHCKYSIPDYHDGGRCGTYCFKYSEECKPRLSCIKYLGKAQTQLDDFGLEM